MGENENIFATEKIYKILLKIAPPVMLAQLIQALYNIVDSFFIGHYSSAGLTALSVIYPIQLLMIALGVGSGVGINTAMAAFMGHQRPKKAEEVAGTGTPVALVLWLIFAVGCFFGMPAYARMSSEDPKVIADVILYGRIVCVASIGLFTESIWSKVLQANGDMKTPMAAQILGAVTNIVLDPLLIFGLGPCPELGIAGAAVATVSGQIVAALVVMRRGYYKSPALKCYATDLPLVYRLGIPNILMQSAYTFYILGLNLILAAFSDQAVTALGLYYKWQTFFFIPLNALQTCMVPIISFNYAARSIDRCKKTLHVTLLFSMVLMLIGVFCFEVIPGPMLRVFSQDPKVISIGTLGFRVIGVSFLPLITSLTYPVFFQAVGYSMKSSFLTIVRTVILFVPLGFVFSRFGLEWFWLTFPVTEIVTSLVGFIFYRGFVRREERISPIQLDNA